MPDEAAETAPRPPAGAPAYPTDAQGRSLGPQIRLGGWKLALVCVLAPAAVGLLAWPVLLRIDPALVVTIPRAVVGVSAGFFVGLVTLAPWRTRPVARWVQWWMATLGVCFAATVAIAFWLLYSASPQERVALGILLAVGHLATLNVFALVLAAIMRARCPSFDGSSRGDSTPTPPKA